MKERITTYLKWMDEMLKKEDEEYDRELLMRRHLREIAFFQHERLVHLIVMALFAVGSFMVFLQIMNRFNISLVLLFAALLILLIPYIKHYFLLENGVQKMYYQYDELYMQIYKEAPAPKFVKRPGYVK